SSSRTATESPTDMTLTTNDPTAAPTRIGTMTKTLLQGGTVVALIVLIVFFFAMRPDVFLSFVNIRNILFQVSILAIIAGAQTLVMVVGDFDLSVGATSSLAGAVAASLMLSGAPVWTSIVVAMLV